MKPGIGITDKNRQAVTIELSKLLADEYVLYTKTRNAHWNIEGPDFFEKHKFFEGQFEQLDDIIDSVAERIRTLGHYTSSSLKLFLELTHLSEDAPERNNSQAQRLF
jgi:starvation-inducible DNA-binding protein